MADLYRAASCGHREVDYDLVQISILQRAEPNEDPAHSYRAAYELGSAGLKSFGALIMTKSIVELVPDGLDEGDAALLMALTNPTIKKVLPRCSAVKLRMTSKHAQCSELFRLIQSMKSAPTPLSNNYRTWAGVFDALLFLRLFRGVTFEVEIMEEGDLCTILSAVLDGDYYHSITKYSPLSDPSTAASRLWTENHDVVIAQRAAGKLSAAESSRLECQILQALNANSGRYVPKKDQPAEHILYEIQENDIKVPVWASLYIAPTLRDRIGRELCGTLNLGMDITWTIYEQTTIPQTDLFPVLPDTNVVVGQDNVKEALFHLRMGGHPSAVAVFICARANDAPFGEEEHYQLRSYVARVDNLRLVVLPHSVQKSLVDMQSWDRTKDLVFLVKDTKDKRYGVLKRLIHSRVKVL